LLSIHKFALVGDSMLGETLRLCCQGRTDWKLAIGYFHTEVELVENGDNRQVARAGWLDARPPR
jgi:hypothetical protein